MTSAERHEARYQRRKRKREEAKRKRRKKYTFDSVFTYENLMASTKRRAKGVTWKASVQRFLLHANSKCTLLERQLHNETWHGAPAHTFYIVERGHLRKIESVNMDERVVQGVLCDKCLVPLLKPLLIYDNGASLEGKGTMFAHNRLVTLLEKHIRKYGIGGYIYLFDYSSFFASIDNAILLVNVRKEFLDKKLWRLYRSFIYKFGPVGQGIGSHVSQIDAIYYLNQVDQFVKMNLGVKAYVRYMDDGVAVFRTKEEALSAKSQLETLSKRLGLTLSRKKCRIIRLTDSFVFLKTRFFITKSGRIVRRLARDVCKRERRRLRKYLELVKIGVMSFKEVVNIFHGWLCSLTRSKCFYAKLRMVHYFNHLFADSYGIYKPPKVKTRKQKVLDYISRRAAYSL